MNRSARWRAVGLMSGTSCDGIDAALVDLEPTRHGVRLVERRSRTFPYPKRLRDALLGAVELDVPRLVALDFALGRELGRAVRQLLSEHGGRGVAFVGSHGHTVYHGPRDATPSTLQIGRPAVVAAESGLTTVADFRSADVASGGEGAPLTPHVNRLLFAADRRGARSIHNLGGISNLTVLDRGRIAAAFDTGPANMLLDAVVASLTRGRMSYDRDGALARRGRAHAVLLRESLRHPFFARRPPKSAGREEFGAAYAERFLARARALRLSAADTVATATALTAASIESAYRRFVLPSVRVREVYLAGGGARNAALRAMLAERLDFARVATVEELGASADHLEAASFAVLGLETLLGRTVDLRTVTRARRPTILGSIHPGANWDRLRVRLLGRRLRRGT